MDASWIWLLLLLSGAVAFSISTLTAGGGALMLVPVLNFLIGVGSTAPVLNTANLIGRPVRLYLYWKNIDWKAVIHYAPFSVLGSFLAGFLFKELKLPILQLIVAVFLISTVFQYRFGKKSRSFVMKYTFLAPLGIIISFLGTLTGASGPVLNPFYLNLGISKDSLIGTKTANSLLMGLSQIGSYAYFDLLGKTEWLYALALGIGVIVGNIIGKKLLARLTHQSFRKWAIAFMMISGVILLVSAIQNLF